MQRYLLQQLFLFFVLLGTGVEVVPEPVEFEDCARKVKGEHSPMSKERTEQDGSVHELERVAREVALRGRMAAALGESLAALIREGAGAGLVDLLYALAGQLAGNGPLENKAEVEQDEVDQPRVNKDKGAQGLRPLRLLASILAAR